MTLKNHLKESYETPSKTHFRLLATLNAVFPDYDFGDEHHDRFRFITQANLIKHVDSTLISIQPNKGNIWEAIESVFPIEDCECYKYEPFMDEEPDGDDNLWSWYYFFYNRKRKRVVFLMCRAVSLMAPIQPEELEEDIMADTPPDVSLSYEQYQMEV